MRHKLLKQHTSTIGGCVKNKAFRACVFITICKQSPSGVTFLQHLVMYLMVCVDVATFFP